MIDYESTGHVTRSQLQVQKLWDRVVWAKQNLEPQQSEYRTVFEDHLSQDSAVKVMVPDPSWLAMALRGDIVPTIDAYLNLPLLCVFNKGGVLTERLTMGMWSAALKWRMAEQGWEYVGEKVQKSHQLHTASTCPAMTEKGAIEYLTKKDVPYHVWADEKPNRQRFIITHVNNIPSDRTYREAWRLPQ